MHGESQLVPERSPEKSAEDSKVAPPAPAVGVEVEQSPQDPAALWVLPLPLELQGDDLIREAEESVIK